MVQQETTDATGLYDAPSVPIGQYSVTFAKEGFRQFIRSNIEMRLETITLNAQLRGGNNIPIDHGDCPGSAGANGKSRAEHGSAGTPVTELPNVGASWYNLLASSLA